MNKKIVGIIIAIVLIIAAIVGVVYLATNDLLKKDTTDSSGKALGTKLSSTNNKQEVVNEEEFEEDENEEEDEDENKVEKDENTESTEKILIAFFSRPDENYNVGVVEIGNTEIMAGFIKDYLGDDVDTFKIDPVKAYPKSYKECTDVATEEKNSNARPEFKDPDILDISNYDTIFIGYPIWWGEVPMIINTFIEEYDFSGKTIIPFCTHEGSGNSGTFSYLKSKMSSSDVNTNGLAIRGTDAREESSRSTVDGWLKELGF